MSEVKGLGTTIGSKLGAAVGKAQPAPRPEPKVETVQDPVAHLETAAARDELGKGLGAFVGATQPKKDGLEGLVAGFHEANDALSSQGAPPMTPEQYLARLEQQRNKEQGVSALPQEAQNAIAGLVEEYNALNVTRISQGLPAISQEEYLARAQEKRVNEHGLAALPQETRDAIAGLVEDWRATNRTLAASGLGELSPAQYVELKSPGKDLGQAVAEAGQADSAARAEAAATNLGREVALVGNGLILATIDDNFDLFDSPGSPFVDGEISTDDLERIMVGDFDRDRMLAALGERGLSGAEAEEQLERMQSSAQALLSNDRLLNQLDAATGGGDPDGKIHRDDLDQTIVSNGRVDNAAVRVEVETAEQVQALLQGNLDELLAGRSGDRGLELALARFSHQTEAFVRANPELADEVNAVLDQFLEANAEAFTDVARADDSLVSQVAHTFTEPFQGAAEYVGDLKHRVITQSQAAIREAGGGLSEAILTTGNAVSGGLDAVGFDAAVPLVERATELTAAGVQGVAEVQAQTFAGTTSWVAGAVETPLQIGANPWGATQGLARMAATLNPHHQLAQMGWAGLQGENPFDPVLDDAAALWDATTAGYQETSDNYGPLAGFVEAGLDAATAFVPGGQSRLLLQGSAAGRRLLSYLDNIPSGPNVPVPFTNAAEQGAGRP